MEDFNPWSWKFDGDRDVTNALMAINDDRRLGRVIIGLRGYKKSGKDTVAAMATGCRRIAFADKLKDVAQSLFDLSDDQVEDQTCKEQVDASWGVTPRFILQRLGSEVARSIHPETWIRPVKRYIEANDGVWPATKNIKGDVKVHEIDIPAFIVTDVRFRNEAQAVKDWGGYLVEIKRPCTGGDNHPSETELDGYKFDYTIDNDGTKEDLKRKVDDMLIAVRQHHEKKWLE